MPPLERARQFALGWIQLVAATPLILKYFMGGIAYGANQPADADGRREGRALAAVAEG
jgi:hypothetical protein